MIVISPDHHPVADKVWRELLGSKPNGARTLGAAQAKYLAPLFEPYYDMMVTYASDYEFEIPEGVKRIAVMVHQNWPLVEAARVWQRTNVKLKKYEVDYFCNEEGILKLIREAGGRAFYLPRFIDTSRYYKFNYEKTMPCLWFGNRWGAFVNEFEYYKQGGGYWISQGQFGKGDHVIETPNRFRTLQLLAHAREVWAIGICALEAMYYGAEVVSYRGEVPPFYDQKKIIPYTKRLLKEIWAERLPGLGK